jgi:hypothetical protein
MSKTEKHEVKKRNEAEKKETTYLAAAHLAEAQHRPNPAARYRFVIVFLGTTSCSVEHWRTPDPPPLLGRSR